MDQYLTLTDVPDNAPDKVPPHPPSPSKHPDETRQHTDARANCNWARIHDASIKLQLVFGMAKTRPEPFVRPPGVPSDLEARFMASLVEYGGEAQKAAAAGAGTGRGGKEGGGGGIGTMMHAKVATTGLDFANGAAVDVLGGHEYSDTTKTTLNNGRGYLQDDRDAGLDAGRDAGTMYLPLLFPSPRVEQDEFWNVLQAESGVFMPQRVPPLPLITLQAPRRDDMAVVAKAKKRRAVSHDAPSSSKARASDDMVGLPILAPDAETVWRFPFPGNSYALLSLILGWTVTMQRLSRLLPDLELFSLNPAFPYRGVSPPTQQKLLALSFYDTRLTPHEETRFLGPTHCAQITYNHVDMFAYTSPPDLHDGRWSYILLQGHGHGHGAQPPHAIIAWPASAVTRADEGLHTVSPDSRLGPLLRPAAAVEGALTLRRRVVRFEMAGRLPLIEGYRVDVRKWEGWMQAVSQGEGKLMLWMER
ncbi:hypothetical protein ACEQ8H_006214 [Pleosporales sp. CAS-2024a]